LKITSNQRAACRRPEQDRAYLFIYLFIIWFIRTC